MAEFSDRIRELLAGPPPTTMTALAEAMEVSREAVSQWAGGTTTPRLARLRRIADHFSVRWQWLASGDEPKFLNDIANVNRVTETPAPGTKPVEEGSMPPSPIESLLSIVADLSNRLTALEREKRGPGSPAEPKPPEASRPRPQKPR